jgi:hypothetical protein
MCPDVAAEGEDSVQVHLDYLYSIADPLAASLYLLPRQLPVAPPVFAHLIPIIIWKLRTRMPSLDSSAIDQDPDFVSIFEDCWCESCYFGLGGEVCRVDGCFAAEGFYCFQRSKIRSIALQISR